VEQSVGYGPQAIEERGGSMIFHSHHTLPHHQKVQLSATQYQKDPSTGAKTKDNTRKIKQKFAHVRLPVTIIQKSQYIQDILF